MCKKMNIIFAIITSYSQLTFSKIWLGVLLKINLPGSPRLFHFVHNSVGHVSSLEGCRKLISKHWNHRITLFRVPTEKLFAACLASHSCSVAVSLSLSPSFCSFISNTLNYILFLSPHWREKMITDPLDFIKLMIKARVSKGIFTRWISFI